MIVERSENNARGRVHFPVVANEIGDYEIPAITQNKQNKVKQLALLDFLHAWIYFYGHNLEGARLRFQELCGKLSSSGAVLEYV